MPPAAVLSEKVGKTARKIISGERLKPVGVSSRPLLMIFQIVKSASQFLLVFAQRREQKLERVAKGADSTGFCGFAKGETATAQIESLRHGTGGENTLPSARLHSRRQLDRHGEKLHHHSQFLKRRIGGRDADDAVLGVVAAGEGRAPPG